MRFLAFLLVGGCAIAGSDQPVDAQQDAPKQIDAPIDAPGPRTLSQTTSQMLKAGNSIACGATGYTRANSYYRVFDLPALGITTAFNVSKVSFQVEHCHANANTGCTVAVRVGTYNGTPGATLTTGGISILQSNATVSIPEIVEAGDPPVTPGGTVDAPITATIPAGQKLVVQVDSPDGMASTTGFYMGSNDGGESGFGYIMATATGCAINSPTNISSVGTASPRHLLLTVTGTY